MNLYTYVIPRDYGFAPNPYFGYCTLATCMPRLRAYASIGDWIIGFGAAQTEVYEKVVYIMQVTETLSFDQYWEDIRFYSKRPVFNKGVIHQFGDNIYHHEESQWVQILSHHSYPGGETNYLNLNRDTGTDRVLISTNYIYFGNNAIAIPEKYHDLIAHGRNYRKHEVNEHVFGLLNYILLSYSGDSVQGVPYSRKPGKFAYYRGR